MNLPIVSVFIGAIGIIFGGFAAVLLVVTRLIMLFQRLENVLIGFTGVIDEEHVLLATCVASVCEDIFVGEIPISILNTSYDIGGRGIPSLVFT